jgi:hypothetical protein
VQSRNTAVRQPIVHERAAARHVEFPFQGAQASGVEPALGVIELQGSAGALAGSGARKRTKTPTTFLSRYIVRNTQNSN